MNSMVLQITLIIVMGNLAILLLKGMNIVMALYRTAMVSVAVLIVLVVTPEPASVSDVYAMIKVINSKAPELPLILVPNRHSSAEDGVDLHKKLNLITQKFLKISINYGGTIVEDNAVRQAVIRQKPFILEFPKSQAAHDVQMVTHRLLKFPAQLVEHRSNIFERLRVKRKEVESA